MKKYLKIHKECLKRGTLPENQWGLCDLFRDDELFSLFKPQNPGSWFWANNGETNDYTVEFAIEYTPLRQNIVILMAAMNGELWERKTN